MESKERIYSQVMCSGRQRVTNARLVAASAILFSADLMILAQAHASPPVIESDSAHMDLFASDVPVLRFRGSRGIPEELHFDKTKGVLIRAQTSNSVRLVMLNSNPLLFTYTAKDITKAEIDSSKAASTLGTAFGKALTILNGGTNPTTAPGEITTATAGSRRPATAVSKPRDAGALKAIILGGVDVSAFAREIDALDKLWKSVPDLIDMTLDPSTIPDAKAKAVKLADDLRNSDPSKSLQQAGDFLQTLAAGQSAVSWTLQYEHQSVPGSAIGRTQLLAELRDVVPNIDDYLDNLQVVYAEAAKISKEVTDIQSVTADVGRIGDVLVATVSYDVSHTQSEPIVIEASSKYSSLLSQRAKDAQKTKSGTYTVTVQPYERIHMRPSVGVIYSFVKSPSFSSSYNASGALKINGTSSSPAAWSAMVAAEFIRDKDFGQGVEPFVQLGVAPESKALGFLFGGGVRAYKAFTFSFGVAYQRVDKLANGLSIGQTITQASDLKTEKEWRPGLYVGIGVKLN